MGKILTFYICENLFGIDITLVKEINRNVDCTPVPGAQSHIVGLLNMRGQVVTIFDLAKLMKFGEKDKDLGSACIILKSAPNDPNQIGFLIDCSGDVFDIDNEECEYPPANIGSIQGEFISSVVKLKDELLMIVKPEKIFVTSLRT